MTEVDTSLEELNRWMLAHHMQGFWTQEIGASRPGEKPETISLQAHTLPPGERTAVRYEATSYAHFVVQASPDATCVSDGQAFPLEAGDLIVNPAWTEHSVVSGGSAPTIWVGAEDIGLLKHLGLQTVDGQTRPAGLSPAVKPDGYFEATQGQMSDASLAGPARRPPGRYAGSETMAQLAALRDGRLGMDQADGILLRFTSPLDGAPTLPTFSCEMQLITSGLRTAAHRHNSTAIYYVFRGEGWTEIAGEGREWSQGDVFEVPPWTWHRHENAGGPDAILFSVDDWPTMVKMGFYRIERSEHTP